MWTSSLPTSIGWMPCTRFSRSCELSQATACASLAKRCRITQSTCCGGLGGITVCSMKPGKPAMILLVSACQRANSSFCSALTLVWVMIETPPDAGLSMLLMTSGSWFGRELVEDPVGCEGQMGEAHPGRVGQCVRDGRGHRVDGGFALCLRSLGTDLVIDIGEEDLVDRHVGEGGDAVIAQGWVDDMAIVVMDEMLRQRPADRHADGTFRLAATLHRVEQTADIEGMNTLQDADLARHPVHGKPDAMHVEGDGTRREIGLALGLEVMASLLPGGMQILERDALVTAAHIAAFQRPVGRIGARVLRGELQDVLAQCLCRQIDRLARDNRAGAGEGAGVVGRPVGIGIDDVDVAGSRAENGSRDLTVGGDGTVAHLRRADGKMEGPVSLHGHLAARAVFGGRTGFGGRVTDTGTFEPIIPLGLRQPAALGQGLLHMIHALVQTVAADIDVRCLLPYGLDPVGGPEHVLAAHGK